VDSIRLVIIMTNINGVFMLKVTLFILFAVLTACSSGNKSASTTTTTKDPIAIQNSTNSNEAKVESIQIIITESFPVQISVVAKGHLPDNCTLIDQVTEERNNNTLVVKILTASQPAGKNCTPAAQTFEEIVPLSVVGLKAGIYAVKVNDITDTFELGIDNIISPVP
jgi:inhibitor of cysteine peptidase